MPGWALPEGSASSDADAAFCAGAALTSLDNLVRSAPPWAGAWRQRLVLKCAAASVRLAGRTEDQAVLRDAWYLRAADADPGPAGLFWPRGDHLLSRDKLLADLPGAIRDRSDALDDPE